MIDIGSISSLAGSLKAASDIAKAMMDLRDTQAFQTKAIELNGEIMSAQSSALSAYAEQTAMVKRISELEKQLAEFEGTHPAKTADRLDRGQAAWACWRVAFQFQGSSSAMRLAG